MIKFCPNNRDRRGYKEDDKNLKEVDEKVEMILLTFDIVFKGVFENNKDILKKFLISTLDLKLDVDTTKIEMLNNRRITNNNKLLWIGLKLYRIFFLYSNKNKIKYFTKKINVN